MRQALEEITQIKGEDCNLSDAEMVDIYNKTTGEEVQEYNETIDKYLNEEGGSKLKTAISFFYVKCNLLENNLITK